MSYLHIQYTDDSQQTIDVSHRRMVIEDGVLKIQEKRNARELPITVQGFPLANIFTYYLSDDPHGRR